MKKFQKKNLYIYSFKQNYKGNGNTIAKNNYSHRGKLLNKKLNELFVKVY